MHVEHVTPFAYRRVGFLSSQGKQALRSIARGWVALPCGQGSVFQYIYILFEAGLQKKTNIFGVEAMFV